MVASSKVSIAARAAEDKKAADVKILDLRDLTLVADYFVICSGRTFIQVQSVAQGIMDSMSEEGYSPRHIEGLRLARWVLIDYGDIVVHVFQQDDREYYGLERLWGDAPTIELEKVEGPAP